MESIEKKDTYVYEKKARLEPFNKLEHYEIKQTLFHRNLLENANFSHHSFKTKEVEFCCVKMFMDGSYMTIEPVRCDFHSLLAVCRQAITPVTQWLINESFSSLLPSEKGLWPF